MNFGTFDISATGSKWSLGHVYVSDMTCPIQVVLKLGSPLEASFGQLNFEDFFSTKLEKRPTLGRANGSKHIPSFHRFHPSFDPFDFDPPHFAPSL